MTSRRLIIFAEPVGTAIGDALTALAAAGHQI
jgi:hypothetical protein